MFKFFFVVVFIFPVAAFAEMGCVGTTDKNIELVIPVKTHKQCTEPFLHYMQEKKGFLKNIVKLEWKEKPEKKTTP